MHILHNARIQTQNTGQPFTRVLAIQNGQILAVQAIGSRAIRETLNAFELFRRYETQNDLAPLRHRIEDVQIIHLHDSQFQFRLNTVSD